MKTAKKIGIAIVGGFVLLAGIAMIFLPGPAILVIPAGLAILATEFEWAQRWLHHVREKFHHLHEKHKQKKEAVRQARQMHKMDS